MSIAFDPVFQARIRPKHSGKLLRADPGTGGAVEFEQGGFAPDNAFDFRDRFVFHSHGDGTLALVSAFSGSKCLEAMPYPNWDGGPVEFRTCSNSNAQRWYFVPSLDGSFRIVPFQAQYRCLQVSGASQTTPALVDIWTCNGGAHQSFDIAPN